MANPIYLNNATTTIRGYLSTTATSIVVNDTAPFPTALTNGDWFLATLTGGGNYFEIVRVTAVSGNVWTVVRAQDNTTAKLWQPGSRIECRVTAESLQQLSNSSILADIANTTDPLKGDALVGVKQPLTGATARTQHDKNSDSISVKDFGAIGDGVVDDTGPINIALATGKSVYFPAGTYRITSTLSFATDGQVLYGDGKDSQSIITNTTNAAPLFVSSVGSGAVYKRRCGLHGLSFVGNTLTTGGINFRGLSDGITGDADKSCWMRDIRITGVGAGWAMRVNSWANNFDNVEIWSNFRGLQVETGTNSTMFSGFYVTGCTQEALQILGTGSSNVFDNCIFQYSGGTNYMLDIQGGLDVTFTGTYLENSIAPSAVVGVTGNAKGIQFYGTFHNLVAGTANVPIITSNVKQVTVDGILHAGGTMACFLRLTGTLPFGVLSGAFVAAGTVTAPFDDQSTRKAGIYLDGLGSRFGPMAMRALTSENSLELRRSDTDALQMFVQNGNLYFGPDTTVPVLTRAGGTLSMTYSAGVGTFRAPQFGLGATGGPLWLSGNNSPEGVVSAPVGSLYSRLNGGASTSLYVKESGTGNTGWIAK